MSRYGAAVGVEGEYEPGSKKRVLRNLLGIKKKSEMDFVENEAMIAAQERYYREGLVTQDTRFNAALLCRMHEDWLGGIYEWAGKYRTVELEKGGFHWPPAYLVPRHMAGLEAEVLSKHTPCRPRQLKDICMSIAVVHAELLLIHPFREGNGRLARWLADLMAGQAGLPMPSYGLTGGGSRTAAKQYLDAVVAGYRQRYDYLARFFEEAALRGLAEEP